MTGWTAVLRSASAPVLHQETLLFKPVHPDADALRAVLAFPSPYPVGITSLGFQVVGASLARRPDLDLFGLSLRPLHCCHAAVSSHG